MDNFDLAFKTVCELVKDFNANENFYLSAKYNETQVRKDFIDKFFEALGWDVNHKQQRNPYKQEVKVEESQINQRRPDYTFYLEPKFKEPKFFVEAKKPAKNLKDADFYFQTIRYARFASTPVAVLTDFEEFHILDCRFKPDINSVLHNTNHKSFHYSQYSDEKVFAEIYYLFSREAVSDNSLENYSENLPKLKIKGVQASLFKLQQQSLDDEFLEYLDDVRETLAKAFKKNDSSLSSDALTEATQRTIDRLVFIRFLEDKLIEPDDYISKIGLSKNSWSDFISLCKRLNAKYNGIVFKEHFIDKQDFGGPELNEFTNVCLEFSQTNRKGFNYNLIPIHILGSIYERFLGKVVVATEKRVRIEDKPEVRKAGGVYYTPKYIVDYIVQNTVGKLIENKSPKEISKLRFADIACGSGSFLIGVFETLLDYHNNYYWNNLKEAKADGCLFKGDIPVLSIKQKQKILLNNIYGVDIDNQAVEVTQLSLALKMLEDETLATANDMQVLFHEKILPDLTKNIVCGNSLIGTDILSGNLFEKESSGLTLEEERKLNPMDFETTFPHIFKKTSSIHNTPVIPAKVRSLHPDSLYRDGIQSEQGFDAIVGNPPYVRIQTLNEYAIEQVKYFNINYSNIVSDSYDIYLLFIYKGYELLKRNGVLGFITPHKFFTTLMGKKLRDYLSKNKAVDRILDFSTNQIFEGATTYTCLLFLRKFLKENIHYKKFSLGSNFTNLTDVMFENINIDSLNNSVWNFSGNEALKILNKLSSQTLRFEEITLKMFKGSSTGNDEIFLLKLIEKKRETSIYFSKILNTNIELENELMKEFVYGEDIKKYFNSTNNIFLLFPYERVNNVYQLINKNNFENKYPMAFNYLLTNKTLLLNRKVNLTKDTYYKYSAARSLNEYQQTKIMIPDILVSNRISIDLQGNLFHGPALHSIIFSQSVVEYKIFYFLGILNSKVFWYYISNTSTALRGNAYRLTPEYLKSFCFPQINFQNSSEKHSHDIIVSLVDQMFDAKKQLHTAKTDKDKTYYERKCDSLDQQIDAEVYKLYGLTEEEIKIVEGN